MGSFGDSAITQDLKAGWEKIHDMEEYFDKLESTQSRGEDVVLPGDIMLSRKQDMVGMQEGFLSANCDIPAGASFKSPHFLFNKVMVTLGCALPNLNEFTKLKRLDVKAIDLRNSQALMTVLPVFFTSGKLSTHIYSSGATVCFRVFLNAKEWGNNTNEDRLQCKCLSRHLRRCVKLLRSIFVIPCIFSYSTVDCTRTTEQV